LVGRFDESSQKKEISWGENVSMKGRRRKKLGYWGIKGKAKMTLRKKMHLKTGVW